MGAASALQSQRHRERGCESGCRAGAWFELAKVLANAQHLDATAFKLPELRLGCRGTDTICRVTAWRSFNPAVPTSPPNAEPMATWRVSGPRPCRVFEPQVGNRRAGGR